MAKPRKWTELEAVKFLESRGHEIKEKLIIMSGCCKGLSGGAALDYLINYQGYRVAVNKKLFRR